ncbi:transformer-2 protein homolog beta-like isoform X9 [Arctopsyche grandis]|uniref:transformer-2 protein homolog beta-like isoform X9 n=1 Tax=Arctopsyche grandis TaxID=121162 RepID=UPI00406D93CE
MSDREWSLSRNGSWGHQPKEGKASRGGGGGGVGGGGGGGGGGGRSRSRSLSRSRSRSRTPAKGHRSAPAPTTKYSRSPSPAHSYKGYRGSDKRTRYRTRSRSPSGGRRGRRSRYSRSRSPSYSSQNYRPRSHSRSPMSSRRRHIGDRVNSLDNPTQSRCLGVFGLSLYTTELQITQIFSKYGAVERVQVVIDAKTGRSRGFCFVYFEEAAEAKVAKEQCTGMEIDGRRIRVDYSITQRAHTPTPGIYMGKPTLLRDNGGYRDDRRRDRDNYYGGRGGGGYGGRDYRSRRSPSPYYRGRGGGGHRSHRYDRSRSRSYSPRTQL